MITDPLSPAPRSEFLSELLAALRRRRRAIRTRVRSLTVEKIVERAGDSDREKLEIECEAYTPHTRLRLFVWSDRLIWVDARQSTKVEGWTWQFSHEGRAAGSLDGRRIVEALEGSIAAISLASHEAPTSLARVWTPLLAQGPRLSRLD